MPHQSVLPLEPFQKWGLDFVGPFIPAAARTGVVTIFGYGVKPSEMNKPRMCNIAHVLANKPEA